MDERQRKLRVLARVAEKLNGAGIVWCVGASLLLYLRGIAEDFHDIDLLVLERDADRAEALMSSMGRLQPPNPALQYRTRRFLEYAIDGVDIDVMAGFVIVSGGAEYDCSLTAEQIAGTALIEGQAVPLHALELWERYYRLMGRTARAELIAAYLS